MVRSYTEARCASCISWSRPRCPWPRCRRAPGRRWTRGPGSWRCSQTARAPRSAAAAGRAAAWRVTRDTWQMVSSSDLLGIVVISLASLAPPPEYVPDVDDAPDQLEGGAAVRLHAAGGSYLLLNCEQWSLIIYPRHLWCCDAVMLWCCDVALTCQLQRLVPASRLQQPISALHPAPSLASPLLPPHRRHCGQDPCHDWSLGLCSADLWDKAGQGNRQGRKCL